MTRSVKGNEVMLLDETPCAQPVRVVLAAIVANSVSSSVLTHSSPMSAAIAGACFRIFFSMNVSLRKAKSRSSWERMTLVFIEDRVQFFDAFVRCEPPNSNVPSTEIAVFVPVQCTGSAVEVDVLSFSKQG